MFDKATAALAQKVIMKALPGILSKLLENDSQLKTLTDGIIDAVAKDPEKVEKITHVVIEVASAVAPFIIAAVQQRTQPAS